MWYGSSFTVMIWYSSRIAGWLYLQAWGINAGMWRKWLCVNMKKSKFLALALALISGSTLANTVVLFATLELATMLSIAGSTGGGCTKMQWHSWHSWVGGCCDHAIATRCCVAWENVRQFMPILKFLSTKCAKVSSEVYKAWVQSAMW